MTTTLDVFISSKMVELKAERDALYALLPTLDYGDIQLRAWVFEAKDGAPASEKSIRKSYLKGLQNSALYLGLFWNQYGEYTIDEFDRAGEWGIERHVYVKNVDTDKRESTLTTFLDKNTVTAGITHKWFKTTDELCEAVKYAIETWLVERLRSRPGGTSAILAQDPDDLTERPRKLIGRDDLLKDIAKLLDDGEQVLLQGFGGMGKTALAASAAGEWIRAGKGTVLWLKCGSASADALFEALARPFNAQQAIAGQQGDAKLAAVRKLLRDSNAKLLVLDDCWNGQALFTVLKAVPSDMFVLATARQRFALDNMLDVGELKKDDALSLLLHHSKGEATDDARVLCKTLGNLAFAIDIAGKTLKARKWTPATLLQEIRDAPHNLETPANFSEPERRSVKALLDTSLKILDKKTQDIFLAFGAFFAPQITLEMIQLFKGKFIPIKKSLEMLQDHGLIDYLAADKAGRAYYQIHELAYSYVKAQINTMQRKRALDACIAYSKQYNLPTSENFAALRPELDNLIGASNWAFASAYYKETEEIAKLLYIGSSDNGGFLVLQGYPEQSIKLLELAQQAAEARHDSINKGNHLGNLGIAYTRVGKYQRALECHQEGLDIAIKLGDRLGEIAQLSNLGTVYTFLEQYDQAVDYHQHAAEIAHEINDKASESDSIGNIGIIYFNVQKYEQAESCYLEALDIAREIDDPFRKVNSIGNLGNVYLKLGRHQEAIEHHQFALRFYQRIGDKSRLAPWLSNLGADYKGLGQYDTAINYLLQALPLANENGDILLTADTLNNLGSTYFNLGEYELAMQYLHESYAKFLQLGIPSRIELLEQSIANVRKKQDDLTSIETNSNNPH